MRASKQRRANSDEQTATSKQVYEEEEEVRYNSNITMEGAELLTRAVMVKWLHRSLCTEQATHTQRQNNSLLCCAYQDRGREKETKKTGSVDWVKRTVVTVR